MLKKPVHRNTFVNGVKKQLAARGRELEELRREMDVMRRELEDARKQVEVSKTNRDETLAFIG